MGGSGGGGGFFRNPEEMQAAIRDQEQKTKDQEFEAEVAVSLGNILSDFERRDAEQVNAVLSDVKAVLKNDIDGAIDSRFGGSVRKHTYVDGISDVDTLLVIKDPALIEKGPQAILSFIEKKLSQSLKDWEISKGQLAVTLRREGQEIQILPAARINAELHIAGASGD